MNERKISILGSTGSIGKRTLTAARGMDMRPVALTADKNVKDMEAQARFYRPSLAVLFNEHAAYDLRQRLSDTSIHVEAGMDGLIHAASLDEADTVVTAVMGIIGLRPTLAAIDCGKRVCIANKETLVCAGELVMSRASERGALILPVDSEHSAVFQCLQAGSRSELKKIILTASGGPFFGKSRTEMANALPEAALLHPNWSMGAKITIDSATMMNKGLELIEAMRLYDCTEDMVDILIHRQSIVHSLVVFCDNSVIAQLGVPDMSLPIQYALTYPDRSGLPVAPELDLATCGALTFQEPDYTAFPCLSLARRAASVGGTLPAAMNGANEAAVALYLEGKIKFGDIAPIIEAAMDSDDTVQNPDLGQILDADCAAREKAASGLT